MINLQIAEHGQKITQSYHKVWATGYFLAHQNFPHTKLQDQMVIHKVISDAPTHINHLEIKVLFIAKLLQYRVDCFRKNVPLSFEICG
jgi:hypothetical protein